MLAAAFLSCFVYGHCWEVAWTTEPCSLLIVKAEPLLPALHLLARVRGAPGAASLLQRTEVLWCGSNSRVMAMEQHQGLPGKREQLGLGCGFSIIAMKRDEK